MATVVPLSVPFPRSSALSLSPLESGSNEHIDYVPGDPSVNLTTTNVRNHLEQELSTPVLDELYDKMWLVARKGGNNIDSLSKQRVKGRELIPMNEMHLYLLWGHDRLFLKPVPAFLLNYDFWKIYLSQQTKFNPSGNKNSRNAQSSGLYWSVALGFVRSYAYLVRSQLDFTLAQQSHLIPGEIGWTEWSHFIKHFRDIDDTQVSRRYHYGQLRISRLNWAVRIFRPASTKTIVFYEIPHWSVSVYLKRALAPLLFGFAGLSLVLSCMQVMLAVPADGLGFDIVDSASIVAVGRVFWGFSIMVLLISGVVCCLLFVVPCGGLAWQLLWGFRHREKKHRSRDVAEV